MEAPIIRLLTNNSHPDTKMRGRVALFQIDLERPSGIR